MLKQNEHWFAASPDNFVSCSCYGEGVAEVKCPLALKDDGLQNAINNGTFYDKKKNGVFELEKAHSCYYQVQHKMHVCNLPYCDLVVWTPKEFLSTRITIDTEFLVVWDGFNVIWFSQWFLWHD